MSVHDKTEHEKTQTGRRECKMCHGEGMITCTKCKGKKEFICQECKGKGDVKCTECNSSGEVVCSLCHGNKKKICPVCCKGKVEKKRWINCSTCHGTGQVEDWKFLCCISCGSERLREKFYKLGECPTCGSRAGTRPAFKPCEDCDGRGQVEEAYYEICPNCHGDYKDYSEDPCPRCQGKGYLTCGNCHGAKHAECRHCKGTGKVTCSECSGEGEIKCPACEQSEKERKRRAAVQKKVDEERKKLEEEQRRLAEDRLKSKEAEKERLRLAALEKAKERRDAIQGCGCLIGMAATVVFLIWWWWEGFTLAALSDMWAQTKSVFGGSHGVVLAVGGLSALVFGLVIIKAIIGKPERSTSNRKRWLFVVLGLPLGGYGIHLVYAKRWWLLVLQWVCFIGMQFAENGSGATRLIYGACLIIWATLWIGGTLFIKHDGNGNRM